MVKLEEITEVPNFSSQLENKILYAAHNQDTSITYQSTYTLKYVLEGTKYYHFGGQQVEVSKGQYLILNNDQSICSEAEKGAKGLSFFLSPELINEIYGHHSSTNAPLEFFEQAQTKSNTHLGHWLHQITQLFEQEPITFRQQKDDLFLMLSEAIVQERLYLQDKFNELKIVKHHTQKELYRLISLAKEYLHDCGDEHLTLDTLSKSIGVSKYYLHRLFTKITGRTPLQYLTYIRLEKAKNRLKYSQGTILDIAIDCGFESLSYFSIAFKKHLGVSPSQYRKSARL
ncbi:hypothetical protein BKI52_11065 [marine bacterium AO1-C]|nr:hypothetical protein BKI52_11065 [marine bacterium AO1-C]